MPRLIDLDDPRVCHILCNLEPRWKPMAEIDGDDYNELNSVIEALMGCVADPKEERVKGIPTVVVSDDVAKSDRIILASPLVQKEMVSADLFFRAERDATNLTGEYVTLYAEYERLRKELDDLTEKIAFDHEIEEARKEWED